jgi:hypothetical protein
MRLIVTTICAILALAAPAQAGRVERAQAVAGKAFNYPCAWTGVQVRFDRPDPWERLDGATGLAWALRGRGYCRVEFSVPAAKLRWVELCHVMIHEYGHLAGVDHNFNPRSVMYESLDIGYGWVLGRFVVQGVDRRCYDRGRRYLGMRPTEHRWR